MRTLVGPGWTGGSSSGRSQSLTGPPTHSLCSLTLITQDSWTPPSGYSVDPFVPMPCPPGPRSQLSQGTAGKGEGTRVYERVRLLYELGWPHGPAGCEQVTHSLAGSVCHSLIPFLARPFARNAHAMPSPLAALSLALAPFCSRSWSSAILAVADHSIAALCNKHLTHFDGQCRNTPSPAACHPPNYMRRKTKQVTDSSTPSTHSRCFSETVENQSQPKVNSKLNQVTSPPGNHRHS